MGAKGPKAIALVLSKKAPADDAKDEEDDEMAGPSKEELAAIKAFDSAKTPEDRAAALKTFIKCCGGE